jgi:hypothetical protein
VPLVPLLRGGGLIRQQLLGQRKQEGKGLFPIVGEGTIQVIQPYPVRKEGSSPCLSDDPPPHQGEESVQVSSLSAAGSRGAFSPCPLPLFGGKLPPARLPSLRLRAVVVGKVHVLRVACGSLVVLRDAARHLSVLRRHIARGGHHNHLHDFCLLGCRVSYNEAISLPAVLRGVVL